MREVFRKLRNSQRWKSMVVMMAAVLSVSFVTTVCLGCSNEVEKFFSVKQVLSSQAAKGTTKNLTSCQECQSDCVSGQSQKYLDQVTGLCAGPLVGSCTNLDVSTCFDKLIPFCVNQNIVTAHRGTIPIEDVTTICGEKILTDKSTVLATGQQGAETSEKGDAVSKQASQATETESAKQTSTMTEPEPSRQAPAIPGKEEKEQTPAAAETEVKKTTSIETKAEVKEEKLSQIQSEINTEITTTAGKKSERCQEVASVEMQEQRQKETVSPMEEMDKKPAAVEDCQSNSDTEQVTANCGKVSVREEANTNETVEGQAADLLKQIAQNGSCGNGQVVIINGRCIDVNELLQDNAWNWQAILQRIQVPSEAQNVNNQNNNAQNPNNQNNSVQNSGNQNNNAQNPGNQNNNTQNQNSQNNSTQNSVDQNTAFVDEVIRLVNQERAKAGLPALSKNSSLCTVANVRAGEIITVFDHTRPNGKNCFSILSEYNIMYRAAGENIAWGQTSPQQVMEGWMNSPGHRANILSANFSEIGVGVVYSGGRYYWAQMFIG